MSADYYAERRERLDRELAHWREIAATPTPEMLRAFAIDLVRPYVERDESPDSILKDSGGSGPPREGKPSYSYSGCGMGGWEYDGKGKRLAPKRGEICVALGEHGGFRLAAVFKIADLATEIRSGARQISLFEERL